MRKPQVLVALAALTAMLCAACADSSSSAPSPAQSADETRAVCAEAVTKAKESAAALEESLLDLTAARANTDSVGQLQAAKQIEAAAQQWSISLTDHSGRAITPTVSQTLTDQVSKLDGFSDAAHNRSNSINPAGALEFVHNVAKNVYWACGYSPDGEPAASASN